MSANFSAVMPIAPRPDLTFVAGEGSWLEDADGRRYLDFVQGWAVNALGHSHPQLVAAIQEQAARLISPSPAFYNAPMVALAHKLTQQSIFDHVFFTNSGAEANEGAIKLARKWGRLCRQGAHKIITFQNGFHGRTLATMAASGKPGWEDLFEPKVPGFTKVPYNDLDAAAQAIDDATVAIMLEPIQGEAGVIPATMEFIRGLGQLTREHNLLLIFDEIQTGMGRTGTLFAYQRYGVEPDIMTLGKGIGGGFPLAALLAKMGASCFDHGDQGGTYNGNPLACAAGVAVFDTVSEPGFLQQVKETADYLHKGLRELSAERGLGAVRGAGLLCALETGDLDAREVVARALSAGLLLNAPRPHTLRFMPSLTVTCAEIDRMLVILKETVQAQ